jgi:hypothetical protein
MWYHINVRDTTKAEFQVGLRILDVQQSEYSWGIANELSGL